jgi:hypothetical protein
VKFTAKIRCAPDEFPSVKLGLAVKWGFSNRQNLADAYLAGADLADADLAGANLAGAYLARANLVSANLARAYLAGANLAGAYLARANLARADLAGSNLAGANLVSANLVSANLVSANLARAYLAGANLAGANLAGANLAGANLDGANLAGARIVERPIRRLVAIVPRLIEPYFFYAFEMDDDGIVWINAGCQWRTVPNYHEHIAHDYPETLKAAETTDILNFITARAAALGAKIDG